MITFTYHDDSGKEVEFTADLVREYNDDSVAEITEHPIERGSPIADHYVLKPRSVSLELKETNEPITEGDGWRKKATRLPVIASRFDPKGLLLLHSAAANAVGSLLGRGKEDSDKANVLVNQSAKDRIQSLHEALLLAQQIGARCRFAVGGRVFRDMQLTRVAKSKRGIQAPTFTVEFSQVRTVRTATADLPEPAELRDKPPTAKGPQSAKETTPQETEAVSASVLKRLSVGVSDMIGAGIR